MLYSTRAVLSRSQTDSPNFSVKPKDILQYLSVDNLKLLTAPICINGKWFLPATPGQAEQLDSLWEEAR